ncbi:MAG: bifunctional 4-hydroxy-2-oxoglutarate aldolase/2-dehydro-3-deoxy-phosphogluconate aldolase [Clostridiales bacterium]|jgi:2-dehydro-3-deoxyphosphogluconate aldolase/(4S)-4-hydroxy-2-oxoglutarate aldolase|nr:bifunctional 4-hydroxy-2-oxoglutarate aldolase/2-dehydro-3-deoxy-phosphogluconate aldolase [Clostridiales bacterium]
MREKIISRIESEKLIAIVRGLDGTKVLKTAEALYKGGISLLEITFDQSAAEPQVAADAIAIVQKAFGRDMLVGAGTVLTPTQLTAAVNAGAGFILSPDTNTEIIKETVKAGLISIPGAFTASECVTAKTAGADFVKLFPAGNGGAEYLKAIRAPLNHIKFLCVGGVTEDNIPAFLKAGAVGFGIGGNLVNKAWIDGGEFNKITELAKRYVNVVTEAK